MGTFEIDLEREEIAIDIQQARLLGLPAGASRLRLCELDSMILGGDAKPLKDRIVEAGQRYSKELRLRWADGGERWLSFAAAPQQPQGPGRGRYLGISLDVTERKLEERNRILAREVQHRVKNVLAVVLAIARQTAFQHAPRSSAEKFTQRVAGLGASLDLLTKSGCNGVSPAELIRSQLAPFADQLNSQIALEGPEFTMKPACAQTLGMAFHELATNSIKYGALSRSGGRVFVKWDIRDKGPGKQFHMSWSEHGGPETETPAARGFGYTVIVSAVQGALGGELQLRYPSSGVVWEVTAPLEKIVAAPS